MHFPHFQVVFIFWLHALSCLGRWPLYKANPSEMHPRPVYQSMDPSIHLYSVAACFCIIAGNLRIILPLFFFNVFLWLANTHLQLLDQSSDFILFIYILNVWKSLDKTHLWTHLFIVWVIGSHVHMKDPCDCGGRFIFQTQTGRYRVPPVLARFEKAP